jgi:hypothetical protein
MLTKGTPTVLQLQPGVVAAGRPTNFSEKRRPAPDCTFCPVVCVFLLVTGCVCTSVCLCVERACVCLCMYGCVDERVLRALLPGWKAGSSFVATAAAAAGFGCGAGLLRGCLRCGAAYACYSRGHRPVRALVLHRGAGDVRLRAHERGGRRGVAIRRAGLDAGRAGALACSNSSSSSSQVTSCNCGRGVQCRGGEAAGTWRPLSLCPRAHYY